MYDEQQITGVQVVLHQGQTTLKVEPDLIPDFHKVVNWFLLNAVVQ
jgi:hypothetical protein